ncbi:prepilin peptidase [Vibrio amylolyticus]|uniref:A24 family peptidase n=1 Tax=Vibrio TaxID=662 RepID=UPI000CC29C84|nr:A24 family peptidase [Vibrio sp. 10N.261.55.A7]PMJ92573.1 hypothetical protein BCU12_07520 [Vibrio sp. 10N.261.55.A7]
MEYLIWAGLLAVATTDARENRIPNLALLYLLIVTLIHHSLSADPLALVGTSLLAGLIMFVISLIMHIAGAMAPGDVKLLGVVGFIVGWGQLLSTTFWIAISTVLVGGLYGAIRFAEEPETLQLMAKKYTMIFAYGKGAKPAVSAITKERSDMLRMPFAPVVVIGLAMQNYF